MAAYNRRWYFLSFLVGLVGVGLISTSLGTDSFIVMDLPREDSLSEDSLSQRHLGFFVGSDYIKIATSEDNYKSWPVPCGDVEEVCDSETLLDNEYTYPRMCDCFITPDSKEIIPMYDTGMWWTTIGFALLASLVGLYASIIAGYNGVTKPTQEILSVRAVLYSFITAIILIIVSIILNVTIYFIKFKTDDGCPLPTGNTFPLPPKIPTTKEQYSCENAKLGMSFYFQIIAAVLWILAILFGFLSQRGFKSIDESSKFDTEKTKDKNTAVESMMF